MRAHRFPQHDRADEAEEGDVGERDDQIELADGAERAEGEDAERRADEPAGAEQQRHLLVDQPAAPVGERGGGRGRDDLRRDGGDRDGRRNAGEDQQRRQQKAAADAEHAGEEPDRPAHAQKEEHVDGQLGDREVKLHRRRPFDCFRCGGPETNKRRRSGAVKCRSRRSRSPLRSGGLFLQRRDQAGRRSARSSAGRPCSWNAVIASIVWLAEQAVRRARDRSPSRRAASAPARPDRSRTCDARRWSCRRPSRRPASVTSFASAMSGSGWNAAAAASRLGEIGFATAPRR